MIPYAPLTPGPGFQAYRAALYYAQRLGVQPRIRRGIAKVASTCIAVRHRTPPDTAGITSTTALRTAQTVARDGIATIDPLLTPAQIEEMKAWLALRDLALAQDRHVRADAIPPGVTSVNYPLETVLGCPHVLATANHPAALAVARRYIGCAPTISSIGIRWSFPGKEASITQGFHRDPDDWRFVKMFIYLTDVDAGSGPHVYVAGSHLTPGALRWRPYHEEDLARRYGRESIRAVAGPAGTTFMADTYGIHKGSVPSERPRLMLQVGYSVLPVFAFRYNPVAIHPKPAVDPYVNRLILA